jgi:hypothetical protein
VAAFGSNAVIVVEAGLSTATQFHEEPVTTFGETSFEETTHSTDSGLQLDLELVLSGVSAKVPIAQVRSVRRL